MVAVPQGASPESYEPSPKEMESLSKASVYFSIGMPAEAIKITPFLQENTKIVNPISSPGLQNPAQKAAIETIHSRI